MPRKKKKIKIKPAMPQTERGAAKEPGGKQLEPKKKKLKKTQKTPETDARRAEVTLHLPCITI